MFAWRSLVAVLAVVMVFQIDAARAQQMQPANPVFSPTGPDAEAYGEKLGYPTGPSLIPPMGTQQNMIGNFSHADQLAPTHTVAPAERPLPLLRAAAEISVKFTFGKETASLAKYLDTNPTTGLLIARNDTILFEHYQYGRTDRDRLVSQSMAKTLTGMLIGIAISEGAIHSVDDIVQTYVPELKGTEMGSTPIRALLHMASGIAFTENFGNPDDNIRLSNSLLGPEKLDPITAVSRFNKRVAPPDTVWHYSNLDTEGLSLVLTHATHMTMSDYLQTRIWQPMGAEASANWQTDRTGQEVGYCCFSATLRDYARFGLLLAHDGALNGRQIIPRQWLLDHDFLPDDLRDVYASVSRQALDGVAHCYERAGDYRSLRLHGDCHLGNLLWLPDGPEAGPHFVDFDDARMGPQIQDLWMLLSGERSDMQAQLADILAGYEDFYEFDARQLYLIEALRTLRLIHYAAWLAQRWDDPAFRQAFPWFNSQRYWQDRILELREQTALMDEPPLWPV